MKILLRTRYAGPEMAADPGSVIDVSEKEGADLVAGGFGVAVPETTETSDSAATEIREIAGDAESAAESPPETASLPPKPRKRIRG